MRFGDMFGRQVAHVMAIHKDWHSRHRFFCPFSVRDLV